MSEKETVKPLEPEATENHEHDEFEEEEENYDTITGVIEFEDGKELPTQLYMTNIELVFKMLATDVNMPERIGINLIGVCELKVMVHSSCMNAEPDVDIEAPNMPAILLITYLTDLFDKGSYQTIFFTGIRGQILKFKEKVDPVVKTMKERLSFNGPNLQPKLYSETKPRKRASRAQSFNLGDMSSTILSNAEIDALRLSLPVRSRLMPWRRLFSSATDGVSLETLFTKCGTRTPIILVCMNAEGDKIGAYLSSGLKKARGFYGTGETFVFNYRPLLSVYKWTHKNEFFTAASSDDVSIGNSHSGGAALFIGESMATGFSDPCDTFGSPVLSTKPHFKITSVEAWHITTPGAK